MSAAGAQSRKFNSSSPFLPPPLPLSAFHSIHTHSCSTPCNLSMRRERARTIANSRADLRYAQYLYARSRSLGLPLGLRYLARSIIRFSACPLVIMAFRTPSDVWPLARSPALIPSYPKSTVGLAIRSIRCLECSLYVWRYCLQKVAKLPRKLRMTWNKELEIQ